MNAFSKKLDNHVAASRSMSPTTIFAASNETLRTMPAVALGIADRSWSIGELINAALIAIPPSPRPTASDRRRRFRVIEGGNYEEAYKAS
jgi:hypothetical protein